MRREPPSPSMESVIEQLFTEFTTSYIFHRGHVESLEYANKPPSLQGHNTNIIRDISEIRVDIPKRELKNWVHRIRVCRRCRGGHLQDIICRIIIVMKLPFNWSLLSYFNLKFSRSYWDTLYLYYYHFANIYLWHQVYLAVVLNYDSCDDSMIVLSSSLHRTFCICWTHRSLCCQALFVIRIRWRCSSGNEWWRKWSETRNMPKKKLWNTLSVYWDEDVKSYRKMYVLCLCSLVCVSLLSNKPRRLQSYYKIATVDANQ